jgi:ATP-dependent DNA ligase
LTKPSLAFTIPDGDLELYLTDPNWVMQQKIDGERALIFIDSGNVKTVGRNGEQRLLPPKVQKTLREIRGQWTFDGESLKDEIFIFDLLTLPKGHIYNQPLAKRLEVLNALFAATEIPGFVPVPSFTEEQAKRDFLARAQASSVEGVVFKDLRCPYITGRNHAVRKYKFTKTVDCFVVDVNEGDKDNLIIAVYNDGKIHRCGKVSALNGDGPQIKQGDVIEVQCLYASQSLKLVQATLPRLRLDKTAEECTIDQITAIKTNKQLLT